MSKLDLSIIIQAIDKFTGPAQKIAGMSDKMTKSMLAGQKELIALGKQKSGIVMFKKLAVQVRESGASMRAAQADVARLGKAMSATSDPSKAMLRDFDRAKKKSASLTKSYRQQSTRLKDLRSELRGAGIASGEMASAERKLGSRIDATTKKMQHQAAVAAKHTAIEQKLASKLQKAANISFISQSVGQVGNGIANALRSPIDAAISFEDTMADVRKVVNFSSPKAFKQMHDDILAMSTVIPLSAQGIGDIVAAAGQAGIAKKELLGFAESAAKMGVAFDLSGAEAGNIMAGWRASLNLTQKQTNELADSVNFLSNNMNAKAGDLAQVISRVGAVAKAAGLSNTEIASLGATLLSSGAPPEIAATGLKNLTLALSAGTSATRMQKAALASLGLNATDMATRMQVDAKGAIMAVFTAMSKLDKAKQPAILKQMFGLEAVGAIAPILSNLKLVQKSFDLTTDKALFAGSMQQEFKIRSKTTSNALLLFNQRMFKLKESIGRLLIPMLNRMMAVITPMIDAISALVERFPNASKVILGAVAVVGGIALVLAPVLTAAVALTAGLAYLRAGMAKTALAAESAGLAGGGKGGKGGGFLGGGKGKGGIKGFFGKLFSRKGFGGVLKGAGGFLKGKGGLIGAGLGALSIGSTLMSDRKDKGTAVAQDVGGIAGGLAGAAMGAAIGSIVPVAGTAIGAAIGLALGGLGFNLGSDAGGALAGLFSSDSKKPGLSKKVAPAALAATMALATPAAAAPVVHQDNRANYTMHVKVDGGDPQAVKAALSDAMAEKEREHAARTRGAMFDYQGG